jgi:tRNA(Ser,Leu) C12 N-acetylase TAN1
MKISDKTRQPDKERMKDWNVVATVIPGPAHEQHILYRLGQLGEFHASPFKDVCLGKVDDVQAFLEALHAASERGEEWMAELGRVIPVEHVFHFDADNLVEGLLQAVNPWLDRLSEGSLCVRVERRGLAGIINSQKVEREVADHLFTLAEKKGVQLHASLEDPDFIIAAETVGNDCGVGFISRALRARYPFVRVA